MKYCPDCDGEMTLLLYSWVCDKCDLKKRERERAVDTPYSRDEENRRFLEWIDDLIDDLRD